LRYSKEGETILDPFVGSGTTVIECKLLNRKGIGIDISPTAIKLCRENLKFNAAEEVPQIVEVGDARHLDFLDDESIDLVIAHPPYADAVRYSESLDGDLSLIRNVETFTHEMKKVAKELLRILRPERCCAILIGDIRRNKRVVPLGFEVFNVFLDVGFVPKEIIIKIQHNCKSAQYWTTKLFAENFLLLMHEYLFIFQKYFK
jgi:DNA modification methylase